MQRSDLTSVQQEDKGITLLAEISFDPEEIYKILTFLMNAAKTDFIIAKALQDQAWAIFQKVKADANVGDRTAIRLMSLLIIRMLNENETGCPDEIQAVTLLCNANPAIIDHLKTFVTPSYVLALILANGFDIDQSIFPMALLKYAEKDVRLAPRIQFLYAMGQVSPQGPFELLHKYLGDWASKGVPALQLILSSGILHSGGCDSYVATARSEENILYKELKTFLEPKLPLDKYLKSEEFEHAYWEPYPEYKEIKQWDFDATIDFFLNPLTFTIEQKAALKEILANKDMDNLFILAMKQINENPFDSYQLLNESACKGFGHAQRMLAVVIAKINHIDSPEIKSLTLSSLQNNAIDVLVQNSKVCSEISRIYNNPKSKKIVGQLAKEYKNHLDRLDHVKLSGVLLEVSASDADPTKQDKLKELIATFTTGSRPTIKLTLAYLFIDGVFVLRDLLLAYLLIEEAANGGNESALYIHALLQNAIHKIPHHPKYLKFATNSLYVEERKVADYLQKQPVVRNKVSSRAITLVRSTSAEIRRESNEDKELVKFSSFRSLNYQRLNGEISAEGQFILACAFARGEFFFQDLTLAYSLVVDAAEKGHSQAIRVIVFLLCEKFSVPLALGNNFSQEKALAHELFIGGQGEELNYATLLKFVSLLSTSEDEIICKRIVEFLKRQLPILSPREAFLLSGTYALDKSLAYKIVDVASSSGVFEAFLLMQMLQLGGPDAFILNQELKILYYSIIKRVERIQTFPVNCQAYDFACQFFLTATGQFANFINRALDFNFPTINFIRFLFDLRDDQLLAFHELQASAEEGNLHAQYILSFLILRATKDFSEENPLIIKQGEKTFSFPQEKTLRDEQIAILAKNPAVCAELKAVYNNPNSFNIATATLQRYQNEEDTNEDSWAKAKEAANHFSKMKDKLKISEVKDVPGEKEFKLAATLLTPNTNLERFNEALNLLKIAVSKNHKMAKLQLALVKNADDFALTAFNLIIEAAVDGLPEAKEMQNKLLSAPGKKIAELKSESKPLDDRLRALRAHSDVKKILEKTKSTSILEKNARAHGSEVLKSNLNTTLLSDAKNWARLKMQNLVVSEGKTESKTNKSIDVIRAFQVVFSNLNILPLRPVLQSIFLSPECKECSSALDGLKTITTAETYKFRKLTEMREAHEQLKLFFNTKYELLKDSIVHLTGTALYESRLNYLKQELELALHDLRIVVGAYEQYVEKMRPKPTYTSPPEFKIGMFEAKRASIPDPLVAIKYVLDIVYFNKEIKPEVVQATADALNISRGTQDFWRLICEGFMLGRGEAFVQRLRALNLLDTLFGESESAEWDYIEQRAKDFDDELEKRLATPVLQLPVFILLIQKEIHFRSWISIYEVQNIVNKLHLPASLIKKELWGEDHFPNEELLDQIKEERDKKLRSRNLMVFPTQTVLFEEVEKSKNVKKGEEVKKVKKGFALRR